MPTSPTTLDSVGLPLGSTAVDFQLKGVDGKTHSLKSFSDKQALVVVFSCNHCPYVQAYEDRLVQIHKVYSAKVVTLVVLNSTVDGGISENSSHNMDNRAVTVGVHYLHLRNRTIENCK